MRTLAPMLLALALGCGDKVGSDTAETDVTTPDTDTTTLTDTTTTTDDTTTTEDTSTTTGDTGTTDTGGTTSETGLHTGLDTGADTSTDTGLHTGLDTGACTFAGEPTTPCGNIVCAPDEYCKIAYPGVPGPPTVQCLPVPVDCACDKGCDCVPCGFGDTGNTGGACSEDADGRVTCEVFYP